MVAIGSDALVSVPVPFGVPRGLVLGMCLYLTKIIMAIGHGFTNMLIMFSCTCHATLQTNSTLCLKYEELWPKYTLDVFK